MKMLRPGASASRAIALVIAITLAACSSGANPIISRGFAPSPLVVVTNKGDVQGFTAGSNRKFLGIPYAAAPTGSLRFEPPQPRAAWTTTLKATQPGTICPQGGPPLAPFGVSQSTSEDCLNLNVTTPTGAAKLPVMVWIHGGAFDQGSGAFYPADQFAEGGIVVVTINYRLGVFGYLALPALDTSGKLQTGNYGIEDQIAALQWVHTNIAAFGGDPTKVTIAGESAGAQSVCMLAENAASGGPAKGLFIRGITESGPCQAPINTLTAAEQSGATTAGQLGCPTSGAAAVTCLQSSSLSIPNAIALTASATIEAFAPSAGGLDIPQQPKTAIGTIPLLAGGNKYEWGLFAEIFGVLGLVPIPASAAEYTTELETPSASGGFYGTAAGTAIATSAQYQFSNFSSGFLAESTTESDFFPTSPIALCYDAVTFQKEAAASQLYAYEFSDPDPPSVLPFTPFAGTVPNGPYHATEIPYLFPLSEAPPSTTPAGASTLPAGEVPLSNTMISYWTNFVKTGNPNGGGLPNWPLYHAPTDVLQLTDTPDGIASGTDFDAEHNCTSFWLPLYQSTGLLN